MLPKKEESVWFSICTVDDIQFCFLFLKIQVQVGIGHNFQMHATGWKWKLTTCLGGDGVSRIRNKSSISPFPGLDFRFGWRADYVLPEITG